ncbi:MAG: Ig-like domain-containing protein [Firmicutes bacterium]|nr:Ig-like domain-containing protein [Bacillota bacterium]
MRKSFLTKALIAVGVMASSLALSSMCTFAEDKWETIAVASGVTESESGYITNLSSSTNVQVGTYTFTYDNSTSTNVTTTVRTSDVEAASAPVITIPDGYKGTVFMVCISSGSSDRTITYADETDSTNSFTITAPNKDSGYGVATSSVKDLAAGTYKVASQTGKWKYAAIGLYLAETEISTTPTLSLIANGDGTINPGNTLQLEAKLNKFDLTSGNYESSNTSVAKVDQNGLVTPVAEGTATITYTATGKGTLEPNVTELVATYDVTVVDPYVSVGTIWDFSEYEEQLNLEGANYTTTYSKLTLVGNSGGSGGKDYVSSIGFHTNGSSNSSRRYISLIPGVDGTLSVTFKSNNPDTASERNCFIGTAVDTNSDSSAIVASENGEVGIVEGELTAKTTYYVYVNNGITIQALTFTPSDAAYPVGVVKGDSSDGSALKAAIVSDGTTMYAVAVITEEQADNADQLSIQTEDTTEVFEKVELNGRTYTAAALDSKGEADYLYAVELNATGEPSSLASAQELITVVLS